MNVDAVLDSGAHGLRYFDEFLPRAARIADVDVTPAHVRAAYDQQRGLDLLALAADVESLGRSLAIATEQWAEQQARVQALESAWSGIAAGAARNTLREHVDRAERDRDDIGAAHSAMGESVRSLESVIADKAQSVGSYGLDVDGKTGADVDAIIDGANGENADLTTVFPDLHPESTPEQIAQRCLTWLAEVFIPQVQEHLTHFVELCAAADQAVREVFTQLDGSMNAVQDPPPPTVEATNPQFDFERVGDLVSGVAKVATVLGNIVVDAAADAVDGLLERLQPPTEPNIAVPQADSAEPVVAPEPVPEPVVESPPTELGDAECDELATTPPQPELVPAPESEPAPAPTPALHVAPAPKARQSNEGALAEAGPIDPQPPETGAELAEAGPL